MPSNRIVLADEGLEESGIGPVFYSHRDSLFVSIIDPRSVNWLRDNERYKKRMVRFRSDIVMNARECPTTDNDFGVSIFVDRDRIIR